MTVPGEAQQRAERIRRELLRLYEADLDPIYPLKELADLDALVALVERVEAMSDQTNRAEIKWLAERNDRLAAEARIAELRHLLRESYEWMAHVEPRPAEPFLEAVRTAALVAGVPVAEEET